MDAAEGIPDVITITHVDAQFAHPKGLGRVALGAAGIGFAAGTHLVMAYCFWQFDYPALWQWCAFMLSLCLYHFAEFVWTAYHHPAEVSFESFLITQSTEYVVATLAGWVEFWVELYFFPSLKAVTWAVRLGLLLVCVGHLFRIGAMWTAEHNFTHTIQDELRKEHKLVTSGIYRYLRHPSYCGWFWWAVGTQVLLGNPVCTVAFAFVAFQFFKVRIPYEEDRLLQFFPSQYPAYRERTWVGIPGLG